MIHVKIAIYQTGIYDENCNTRNRWKHVDVYTHLMVRDLIAIITHRKYCLFILMNNTVYNTI